MPQIIAIALSALAAIYCFYEGHRFIRARRRDGAELHLLRKLEAALREGMAEAKAVGRMNQTQIHAAKVALAALAALEMLRKEDVK